MKLKPAYDLGYFVVFDFYLTKVQIVFSSEVFSNSIWFKRQASKLYCDE